MLFDSTSPSGTQLSCACGTPERLTGDSRYTLRSDPETGGVQFLSRDGREAHTWHYCPWCGGQLPSGEGDLFAAPDLIEVSEVSDLLSAADSLDEVLQALGKPDRTMACGSIDTREFGVPSEPTVPGKQIHQYLLKWKTLDVHVLEYVDGSIAFTISGKYRGDVPSAAPPQRRRWRLW